MNAGGNDRRFFFGACNERSGALYVIVAGLRNQFLCNGDAFESATIQGWHLQPRASTGRPLVWSGAVSAHVDC